MSLATLKSKVERLIEECKGTGSRQWWLDTLNQKTDLTSFFSNTNITELPKFEANNQLTTVKMLCYNCILLKCFDDNFDTSPVKEFTYGFSGCRSLEYVRGLKTPNATNCYALFNTCIKLHTIYTPLDFSNVTNLNIVFNNCGNLVNVLFVPNSIKISISFAHSSVLNDESIQSIIDGLADLTGQTTQYITFNSVIANKLTAEQNALILSKNWYIG